MIFFILFLFWKSLIPDLWSPSLKTAVVLYFPVSKPCFNGEKKHTPRLFLLTMFFRPDSSYVLSTIFLYGCITSGLQASKYFTIRSFDQSDRPVNLIFPCD